LSRDLNAGEYIASCLEGLAGVQGHPGRAAQAARLFGAAATLRAAMGAPLASRHQADYEADLAAVRTVLDGETFASSFAAGAALPLERAVAEALAMEGCASPDVAAAGVVQPP
jgi:hypothetical protein